jgi:hypothetical protein
MRQQAPTLNSFHNRLIEECFSTEISDSEAFLLFVILHNYVICFPGGLLRDAPHLTQLLAETQRGASEALAYLWRNTKDERRDYAYWYWRWNTDWKSYAHAENLSFDEQQTLNKLLAKLREHPWVVDLYEED